MPAATAQTPYIRHIYISIYMLTCVYIYTSTHTQIRIHRNKYMNIWIYEYMNIWIYHLQHSGSIIALTRLQPPRYLQRRRRFLCRFSNAQDVSATHTTHCNTLCNTLQHTLQHTATHCNTLPHTATHMQAFIAISPSRRTFLCRYSKVAIRVNQPSKNLNLDVCSYANTPTHTQHTHNTHTHTQDVSHYRASNKHKIPLCHATFGFVCQHTHTTHTHTHTFTQHVSN